MLNELLNNPWCAIAVCQHLIVWTVTTDSLVKNFRKWVAKTKPDFKPGLVARTLSTTIIGIVLIFWPLWLLIYMILVMMGAVKGTKP